MRISYEGRITLEVNEKNEVTKVTVTEPYDGSAPTHHDDPVDQTPGSGNEGSYPNPFVWRAINKQRADWPTLVTWETY